MAIIFYLYISILSSVSFSNWEGRVKTQRRVFSRVPGCLDRPPPPTYSHQDSKLIFSVLKDFTTQLYIWYALSSLSWLVGLWFFNKSFWFTFWNQHTNDKGEDETPTFDFKCWIKLEIVCHYLTINVKCEGLPWAPLMLHDLFGCNSEEKQWW